MPSGSNLKFSDIFKQAPEIWLRRNAHGSIRVQERLFFSIFALHVLQ